MLKVFIHYPMKSNLKRLRIEIFVCPKRRLSGNCLSKTQAGRVQAKSLYGSTYHVNPWVCVFVCLPLWYFTVILAAFLAFITEALWNHWLSISGPIVTGPTYIAHRESCWYLWYHTCLQHTPIPCQGSKLPEAGSYFCCGYLKFLQGTPDICDTPQLLLPTSKPSQGSK